MSDLSHPVYKKNPKCPWQTINGETLVVDPINQFSFELSELGTFIWCQIDGTNTVQVIKDQIQDHFEVSPEEAEKDLNEFIDSLKSNQLIDSVPL